MYSLKQGSAIKLTITRNGVLVMVEYEEIIDRLIKLSLTIMSIETKKIIFNTRERTLRITTILQYDCFNLILILIIMVKL